MFPCLKLYRCLGRKFIFVNLKSINIFKFAAQLQSYDNQVNTQIITHCHIGKKTNMNDWSTQKKLPKSSNMTK